MALFVSLPSATASAQQSRNVTLLSHMNLYDGYSSCWSYVHSDGREYAFELAKSGASVVRLTDPQHPVEVAFFNLVNSDWHEGRQYRNWFYITTESRDAGRAITGLTIVNMADPDHPRLVSSYHSDLASAHTIDIDLARGLLYAAGATGSSGQGTYVYSLADPENPALLAVYGDAFPNYIHTIHVTGTRGYASMPILGVVRILDLTDPAHATTIAEFKTPAGSNHGLTHSSWESVDGRYLYVSDSIDRFGLYVFDVQNLAEIHQVYSFEGMPFRSIPHDPVARGNLLFASWYTSGARVFDISNPAWPVEIGFYDTFPGIDGGEEGCWEVAPMFPSGIFIASDRQTGLYVFRLNATYGIVRGTVRQASNGPTISGAVIRQLPDGPSTVSFSDGRYSIAVPPGGVTLSVSKFGYDSATQPATVAAGSDQTLDMNLRLSDAGSVSGVVSRASDAATLSGADLQIVGTPLKTTTNASGAYSFPSVPAGTYSVRCTRPGQVPATLTAIVIKNKATALSVALSNPLTYDDAEADRGWVVGDRLDDATRGIWVRAVPNGVIYQRTGEQVQTDRDRTPDPGAACFVTGNAIPSCPYCVFDDDVSGRTTLTSPAFHLGGVADPRIGYWRWFANYFYSDTPDDPLVTQLSNDAGRTWTSIDSLYDLPQGWQYAEIKVSDFFPNPGDILVRFIASKPDFGVFEAAIDDISSYPGGGAALAAAMPGAAGMPSAAAGLVARVGRAYPSPTRGGATIEMTLPAAANVRADIFDVSGRLVRSLVAGSLPAGDHWLTWDGRLSNGQRAPAGRYWLRTSAGSTVTRSSLVIVH
jgi:choice-of-anchor B domain-containing protein